MSQFAEIYVERLIFVAICSISVVSCINISLKVHLMYITMRDNTFVIVMVMIVSVHVCTCCQE